MNQQIDLMETMCNENLTEAIGKPKELLESYCKTNSKFIEYCQ